MKKIILLASVALLVATVSCKRDEIPTPQALPVVEEKEVTVTGDVATTTWVATKKYILKGSVFVRNGQTLTIEPGTIIMGDKASKGTLVIDKGGKLIADGTADKPIVFTSILEKGARDAGDWGGIVILGSANCNQNAPSIEGISPAVSYGTQNSTANDTESSGTLRYVRVEYAGIALSPNNETNGITFGAVGSGTVVENVQVSYGGDDAFEFFGGTVNCKNIISLGTWDDDFDCDFGYTGNVQFALALRDAYRADQSGSNGFEVDNDGSGTSATPQTAPKFSNVSVYGPVFDSTKSINANFQHAMHLRRNSAATIANSILTGFPTGLNIDGSAAEGNYNNNFASLKSNILISVDYDKTKTDTKYKDTNDDTYWNDASRGNTTYDLHKHFAIVGIDKTLLIGANTAYPSNPNFAIASGDATSGANTAGLGSYFTGVSFRGAFGSTDWTDTWSEFDPQNREY